MPGIPRRLLGHRIAPVTAMLLGVQARRASIPALGRVVHRLGVDAEWVIFGHVHRRGPLAGDDARRWRGPGGRPQLANTGSWVHEPCSCIAPARRTRIGPAERSCSRTAATRRRWGCLTSPAQGLRPRAGRGSAREARALARILARVGGWKLQIDHRVRVPVDDLPGALLEAEDHRGPQDLLHSLGAATGPGRARSQLCTRTCCARP